MAFSPLSSLRPRIGSGPHTALAVAISLLVPMLAQAGDLLRGGARAGERSGGALPASPNPAIVDQARVNASDALARTTQTMQAMRAMQQAARDLAQRGPNHLQRGGAALPNVPNGLAPGGLKVATNTGGQPTLWQGATLPRQNVKNGQTNVVVTQNKQQALLQWENFNIGKKTTLTFDQSKGGRAVKQWVAINQVNDPSGLPSQILGQIRADGQVYVINQNGIIFGGSSQVNTHGLVASSLPINTNLVARGLLNNPDAQFLFSALDIPALTNNATMPAFTAPAAPNTPGGRLGDVVVEKGAQLTAPTSPEKVGGRIALIGPNVRNAGTISTPDGQTILAAGLQVGFQAHATSDPSLRGLDVYIGKVRAPAPPTPAPTPENPNPTAPAAPPAYAGTATNSGLIDAPRAHVAIAGSKVEQLGVVQSSTSVSLNGRIDLLASFNTTSPVVLGSARFASGATGQVTLGPGSVTSILPELFSDETIASGKLPIPSQINIEGKSIRLGGAAQILAPNANVTLRAGSWLPFNGATTFVTSGGQIYLEPAASINVAGTPDVLAALAQNILTLELRGAELADSPQQRDGILRGLTLNLDMRKTGVFNGLSWSGTPLGDASGFLNLIERNVAQLTTAGGNVTLSAGGSVVMRSGSSIDVSGGWTNFEGGFVETTRVVSSGRLYDISSATPDLTYTGIYRAENTTLHQKWGIAETFSHPLGLTGRHWEDGYRQGADAGTIAIQAPSMALDGTLLARTVPGPRQREQAPRSGSLSLNFTAQDATHALYLPIAPTPPVIQFGHGAPAEEADDFALNAQGEPVPLRADRRGRVQLSPNLLTQNGFGQLTIENPGGDIIVPAGVTLQTPARGSLQLAGANVQVEGKITSPGGKISLTAYNIEPGQFQRLKAQTDPLPQTPPAALGRGALTIGPTSTLSTAGLIVDERPGRANGLSLPVAIHGGTIQLTGYDVKLATGSTVDVSGGLRIDGRDRRTWGDAGSISIKAGQDANLLSLTGGSLELGATLRGYSGGKKAGSLEILAPLIQIGGKAAQPDTLVLAPEFFSTGGFGNFQLTGLGAASAQEGLVLPAILVAPGTTVAPVVQSVIAGAFDGPNGTLQLLPFTKPVAERPPVSLTLNAPGISDSFTSARIVRGEIHVGAGASLQTDPLGAVTIKGDTVSILGSITAPGGQISITGSSNSTSIYSDQTQALTTVYLGPTARLSTRGTTLLTSNPFGHRTGWVLPGGSIRLAGNIAARARSVIDVSGATDWLDFAPEVAGTQSSDQGLLAGSPVVNAGRGLNLTPFGQNVVSQRVDSDAGSITLVGGQSLQSDATLFGSAGGPQALGGSLTVSSGRFYAPSGGTSPTPLDVTLQVTAQGRMADAVSGLGQSLPGFGQFAVQHFTQGGFDALALKGTVEFSGDVSISARRELSVADSGVLFANGNVQLAAPYVKLGTPLLTPLAPEQQLPPFTEGGVPYYFKPSTGTGHLSVRASLIEVGNLSLQNISKAELIADGGDIRGAGTLDVAGDLTLRAAQIYPPTALTFTITASEKNIAVAMAAQGSTTVTLASAILPPGFGVGSPLLGSTVTNVNGTLVTLSSGANASITTPTLLVYAPGSGSVAIEQAGSRQLPWSAGGQLNIFGSTITQSGTLIAPFGGITLGWDGTGSAPKGAITGQSVPITQRLTLAAGSLTSVSAISPVDGTVLTLPYGLYVNDTSWIDPRGIDITGGGGLQKTVTVSAAQIDSQRGSLIDVRGGGDLFAYRWVKGLGGSRDLLASEQVFAVIPGYDSPFTPYAPFNPSAPSNALGGDRGYVNTTLKPGDSIHLEAGSGLPAGTYTLLPARYALMPGAFLVTPKTGTPIGSFQLADGSSLVNGYRFNGLNTGRAGDSTNQRFEIAPAATWRQRAEYHDHYANEDLLAGAQRLETTIPRLPGDAGHLILQASQSMTLQGRVAAQASDAFRAGLVDIASASKIVINRGEKVTGALTLNAAQLNAFGAESLLIGGIRTFGTGGTLVTVRTGEIVVDNAGSPLRGPEIILAAKDQLTLAPGASIQQLGTIQRTGRADTLLLGSASAPGSGNGVLIRVSSDANARTIRSGIDQSPTPHLTIGAGAAIAGASIMLDSTAATSLDSSATLSGQTIALQSGQISLQLDDQATLPANSGLQLSGEVLNSLRLAQRLSLLSYSTLDLYGAGTFATAGALEIHAASIRGFAQAGQTATIQASKLLLDNSAQTTFTGSAGAATGQLAFQAGRVRLGQGSVNISQFQNVLIDARDGVVMEKVGSLTAQSALTLQTPFVTGAKAATYQLTADGTLEILASQGGPRRPSFAGLGANLSFTGASVRADSYFALPSGVLTLHARTGDLVVNGELNAAGTSRQFYDLTRYTGAGKIILQSDQGDVTLGADSQVNVAAAGPASAGSVAISAPQGAFTTAGQLKATGGGNFALDVGQLPNLDTLTPVLAAGEFTGEQSFRVRTGDVEIGGTQIAHRFSLSADTGSILVTGTIDTSGERGGHIALIAGSQLTVATGARLSVAAETFDAAGKGGSITLETRGLAGGQLDVQAGSTLDLSVAAKTATSAGQGQFSGTLHLRAPQTSGGTDLAVQQLAGTILDASRITVEGYKVYDLTGTGTITSAIQDSVFADGTTFGNGTTAGRLLGANSGLEPVLIITPGAEIINQTGNLTLGTSNSTATSDWNLATFRFGPKQTAGALTLRAAGNLVFFNALSDGFETSAYNSVLLGANGQLPANAQSWSYRLTAGADFTAADTSRVTPLAGLAANTGSLLLGKNAGTASATTPGLNAQTAAVIGNRYQVIRTGSGDITISTGRDVQLLNQFATIYTAGTQVTDPTLGGTFDLPKLISNPSAGSGVLGAPQQNPAYPAQFTLAGGNITIAAQGDIAHYTRNNAGQLIADSSRELPMNWLYRRGYLDQSTGQFGIAGGPGRGTEVASTAWWVDFSNFFQGVGALGGGNVTLEAGRDIANVDAVISTNARMPKGQPDASRLVELGGGDLIVRAGRDLDAGVYYVERGHGLLSAGGSIKTNATRSPSLTNLNSSAPLATETWLPTTLFVGKSGFDVSARGDVLLGPAANPFLLPGGYNNTVWYKTYFSTYAEDAFVNVTSLAGNVTLRESSSPSGNTAVPILQTWLQDVLALKSTSASFFQPWLRLNETSPGPFATVAALAPGTLRATAFSGDINVVGSLTLSPSARGTIELAAASSVNGVNRNGSVLISGTTLATWGSATINLSDANPASIPGSASPFAYQTLVGTVPGLALTTAPNFLASIDALFNESGALRGPDVTLTSKQALHAPGPLHAGDTEPVRIYAGSGNISGLTLFSGKSAQLIAARDVSDIALYVQNVSSDDLTVVAAGRDITAYHANSPLRVTARSAGNILNLGDDSLAGDIQLAGPGTLEVLAGRNLDLGIGSSNTDGTNVGIATVGNTRNPALPFEGADIIAGAGLGPVTSLAGSQLDFATFADQYLTDEVLTRYWPELNLPAAIKAGDLKALSIEQRNQVALAIFYRLLRDSGRGLDPSAPQYATGIAAAETLLANLQAEGDISLTSRAIKTQSGGNISLLAPGGKLSVGFDVAGAQVVDQGLLTEAGGNISIFTGGNVDVGTSRIFTLRGGDIMIWSSGGDIAAGAAAKTVAAAPPTRVIIDPQSADIATDLAGLATGGGIGVLATVAGIPPGDVDLIAPKGTIDAGDAGIRSAGNLNVAAVQVLNAENIQVSGSSAGTPPPTVVAAPNLGALTAAASTTGATTQTAAEVAKAAQPPPPPPAEEIPSIVTVEVLGYGGGE